MTPRHYLLEARLAVDAALYSLRKAQALYKYTEKIDESIGVDAAVTILVEIVSNLSLPEAPNGSRKDPRKG